MATKFRKIAAMAMPDVTPGGADMPEPKFDRAKPEDLLVDESYQRGLSERSAKRIRDIVANWQWATFTPPVVVAGDLLAVRIDRVCRAAGITILRNPWPADKCDPGMTVAISTVSSLVKRRGDHNARVLLEALVRAELAPISAAMIKACDVILYDDRHQGTVTPAALSAAIRAAGAAKADLAARKFAAHHGVPVWSALVGVLLKACNLRAAA